MPQRDDKPVLFENAQIAFRNFRGVEGPYNREGDRNFCIILEPAIADDMARDGWNIKTLKPDENNFEQPYIEVKVGFKAFPPMITMIGETSKRRTQLDEGLCGILDDVDIVMVDLMIRPYDWEVNDKTGRKAYLKTMYVTIFEDPLMLKYGFEDPATRSGGVED
jgi:hypothetical protein